MRRWPSCALFLLFAGCAISTMDGHPDSEVTFHFDRSVNHLLMWGRTAGIALLGGWVMSTASSRGSRLVPTVIGLGIIAVGLYGLLHELPLISSYRIDVRDSAVTLHIPPDLQRRIEWPEIESVYVEGFERDLGSLKTQDWKTMTLTLVGGDELLVNLERLSIEQRRGVFMSIVRHAQMVETPVDE